MGTSIEIKDGVLQILHFIYKSDKSRDKEPRILLLHQYEHPKTGNSIVAGVNLNYLSQEEKDLLFANREKILVGFSTQDRVVNLGIYLRGIFDAAFRHYVEKNMSNVLEDTIDIESENNPL